MRLALLALCSVAFCGCALEAGESSEIDDETTPWGVAASDEETASLSQALLGGWASGPYTWSQGSASRTLQPFASNICVLTRLSGHFEGDGESVRVWHDDVNWYLGGGSQQSGVSGEATCFPRSKFVANGTDNGVSAEFSAWARGISECSSNAQETWWGDAATALTGLRGKMDGGGEYAKISQSPGAFAPSLVIARTCAKYLTGYAHSFWVGKGSSGRLARFIGPNGVKGDVNKAGEFAIGSNGSVIMARTSEAACYFTRIQGSFQGGGESVQIRAEFVEGTEFWVLRTRRGSASSSVGASARCYLRDQR